MPLIYVNIVSMNLYNNIVVYFCLDFLQYQEDSFLESSVSLLSERNESLVSKYIQMEKSESNVKTLRAKSK